MSTVMFARPAAMAPEVLALAESMWAFDAYSTIPTLWRVDDSEDILAALLGLEDGDGHDELARCQAEGCGTWFWADDGAVVQYESGRDLAMCDEHAVPDDPGARVYPGARLEELWRDRDAAAARERMRTTGSAW